MNNNKQPTVRIFQVKTLCQDASRHTRCRIVSVTCAGIYKHPTVGDIGALRDAVTSSVALQDVIDAVANLASKVDSDGKQMAGKTWNERVDAVLLHEDCTSLYPSVLGAKFEFTLAAYWWRQLQVAVRAGVVSIDRDLSILALAQAVVDLGRPNLAAVFAVV